jgi:hypothetical protein
MKKFMQSMRIAFRALTMNKLRSALTMLGIVIGVASVIATLAIGLGATHRIQDQIASIGSRVAVLGKTVVDNLFVGADAIGQTIRIKNVPFTVVGTPYPQRPVFPRTGSGRCHSASDFNRQAKSHRDQRRECGRREHDHDAGKIRCPDSGCAGGGPGAPPATPSSASRRG